VTEAKPHSVTDSRKTIRAYYETNRAGWHQGVTIKLADAEKREPSWTSLPLRWWGA